MLNLNAFDIAQILLREMSRANAIAYAERIARNGGDLASAYGDAVYLLRRAQERPASLLRIGEDV